MLFLLSCWNNQENSINNNKKDSQAKTAPIQKTIVALWDSLTAWYNLDISDSYPHQLSTILKNNWYNYTVINAWVSGDTSKNLLDRIELYDDIDADIYIVGIGGNDWLRKLSTSDLENNILKIIDHLENVNPDSQIVLAGMQIPLNAWIDYSNYFKELYFNIKKKKTKIYLFPFLLEWVATKQELNLSDWIHPNRQWYAIIAQNLYDYIEENTIITK